MLSLNAIQARIHRQKIKEFCGDSFVPGHEVHSMASELRALGQQQFLFGIHCGLRQWTAVSVTHIFSKNREKLSQLMLCNEGQKLFDYFSICGNEFADIAQFKDGRSIWLKSQHVCPLVINIVMALTKLPPGIVLED